MNRGVFEFRRVGRSSSVCGSVVGFGGSIMVVLMWVLGCWEKVVGFDVS